MIAETAVVALPSVSRRLLAALLVSVVIHALIALGTGPKYFSIANKPLLSFHVELRQASVLEPAPGVILPEPSKIPVPASVPETPPLSHGQPSHNAPPTSPELQSALPLDVYYPSQELDFRAEPINEVDLIYPQLAYQRRIAGKVQLRLFISEHGTIDEIALVHGTPPGTFDEAAIAATLQLRFKPAIRRGRNVKSQKTIELVFNPYESINTP